MTFRLELQGCCPLGGQHIGAPADFGGLWTLKFYMPVSEKKLLCNPLHPPESSTPLSLFLWRNLTNTATFLQNLLQEISVALDDAWNQITASSPTMSKVRVLFICLYLQCLTQTWPIVGSLFFKMRRWLNDSVFQSKACVPLPVSGFGTFTAKFSMWLSCDWMQWTPPMMNGKPMDTMRS